MLKTFFLNAKVLLLLATVVALTIGISARLGASCHEVRIVKLAGCTHGCISGNWNCITGQNACGQPTYTAYPGIMACGIAYPQCLVSCDPTHCCGNKGYPCASITYYQRVKSCGTCCGLRCTCTEVVCGPITVACGCK